MADTKSIELIATEPGGTDRTGFPLTVGVPFARGVMPAGEPVALVDEFGTPHPLQARVMEAHDDGSTRWLLLDYQQDFTALRPSRIKLVPGQRPPDPPQSRRIEVEQNGGLLRIDNGVLKMEIDRDACRPLLKVWHKAELVSEGGLEFTVTAADGRSFRVGNDTESSFQIEESGPLRLALQWDGTHRDEGGEGHFDFTVRLNVYAGNPFVRVDHIFTNRLDPDVTDVRQIAARLPIHLGKELKYTVSDVYRLPTMFVADQPVRLEQYKQSQFRIVGRDANVLKEMNNNAMGWVDASGPAHGLLIVGKNFWQNYPKALSACPEAVQYELIPDGGQCYPVPRGMAKTHTFFLYFHDGQQETEDLRDLAFIVQRWPMAKAPSVYYQQSGEVWDFFPYFPETYPRLEASLRNFFNPDEHHLLSHEGKIPYPTDRAYGLKHYGDFVQAFRKVHFDAPPDPDAVDTYYINNEYDTPHVLAMMFLRTGEIAKWWGAEVHGLHMADIDTCHHAVPMSHLQDHRLLADCQWRHCYQHIGSIQVPEGKEHITGFGGHTFGMGLVDLYHLTGERRYFEVARGYARHLAWTVNEHILKHGGGLDAVWPMGRQSGWAMTVLGPVHKVEPEDEYVKAVGLMLDKVEHVQHEIGRLCRCNWHPKAFEDRGVHLFVRGLIQWHLATGCERTKRLILNLIEGLLERTDLFETGTPLYSDWPELSRPTTASQGFANLESLAYAYDLTGDRRFIDVGLPGLCQAVEWINHPTVGKGRILWERILRGPLRFMAITHELGILAKIPEAGAWVPS